MNTEFALNSIDLGSRETQRIHQLKEISKALEATFLSEMLKHSGLNETSESFGGGAGEEAFSSMLNQQFANSLAERGGVGLAEHIFRSISGGEGSQ